jgi:hypothetical protein
MGLWLFEISKTVPQRSSAHFNIFTGTTEGSVGEGTIIGGEGYPGFKRYEIDRFVEYADLVKRY